MPIGELFQLVQAGDLSGFEKTCLERLEEGTLELGQLVAPLRALEKKADVSRLAGLSELVLDNVDLQRDPAAALEIGRIALTADPDNAALRGRVAELYRRAYPDTPGLEKLLEASGLIAGRPARTALRMLDLCLTLRKGEPLLSRSEGVCAEVIDVDLEHGLVTVRVEGQPRNFTTSALAREYERANPDDLRVLRQLYPERLRQRLESEPLAVVIELLRLHGGSMDSEQLKHELTPRFLEPGQWSKWWSALRAKAKRDPHIVMEGRAPVLLRYSEQARTLEDETREQFDARNDPRDWLDIFDTYLREKKRNRENPDTELLAHMLARAVRSTRAAAAHRPVEALACALVADRIRSDCPTVDEEARDLAAGLLRQARDPADLIAGLPDPALWELAFDALLAARPADAAAFVIETMPAAPAAVLDRIVSIAASGGLVDAVNAHISTAVADPVDHPEIIFWLWRGPAEAAALKLPARAELFTTIIETLSALGRTLHPGPQRMKRFRQRMRAALALQDYVEARRCIEAVDAHRAVTLRTQLQRLEGIGDGARSRLLEILRDVHPSLWQATREQIEPWAQPDVLWTTQAGLDRRVAERDHMVNVTMRENARRIGEAAAHGDLSENSEYKFALEERDLLRARLAQMNHEISLAEVINPADVPTAHIGIGSRAVLREVATGRTRTVTFLGPFDADVERGIFNYRAPFSQKLMGRRPGERAVVPLDGRDVELEVVEITNGLA